MNRRSFLATAAGTTAASLAGCLAENDHLSALETEIESRGVTVTGMELNDGLVRVAYESSSESANDDLAEVAMAFVERVDDGWRIDRLEGLARASPDMVWHAEAAWAREYLDGAIEAGEYGQRISETMEQTLILDEGDGGGLNGTETGE
jgi:hypothetical protein